jgi:site-specific recombinase XerD
LAPSTINRRLGFVKHYAAWGLEERFVDASVFRAIKDVALVRQQKLAPKVLSQADMHRLLKEVELQPDVPWTNNPTEQVIGRMKMRARTVRGYKTWAGMASGLMTAGVGVA